MKKQIYTTNRNKKISDSMKQQYKDGKRKINPNFKFIPYGNYEEMYGIDKALNIRKKQHMVWEKKRKELPINFKCSICKTEMHIAPCLVGTKKYCNKKCAAIGWLGRVPPNKGSHVPEEQKERQRKKIIGRVPTTLERLHMSIAQKKIWNDPIKGTNRLKKILQSRCRRPTCYEKQLTQLIEKYQLPYKYVGDGSFLIGFLNPDFVNVNGEKTCIEVYHDYWKIKSFGSEEKYQTWRNKLLDRYGWKAIYLNDIDMKCSDEEIIKKISE